MTTTQPVGYTIGEEIANSITHGIGMLFSITGTIILLFSSGRSGDIWQIISSIIYGSSLILLYSVSTLYHAVQRPKIKSILQLLDHSAIFLLIAGCYTPFTLLNLRGPWGWSLFAVIWFLAITGILLEVFSKERRKALSVGLYIIMGWAIVLAIKPLIAATAYAGVMLLLIGGLCYTGGVVFYVWRKLPYSHAVWHVFVLAGSIFHYFAVLFYAVPPGR